MSWAWNGDVEWKGHRGEGIEVRRECMGDNCQLSVAVKLSV